MKKVVALYQKRYFSSGNPGIPFHGSGLPHQPSSGNLSAKDKKIINHKKY
jgi:hypothetical protein